MHRLGGAGRRFASSALAGGLRHYMDSNGPKTLSTGGLRVAMRPQANANLLSVLPSLPPGAYPASRRAAGIENADRRRCDPDFASARLAVGSHIFGTRHRTSSGQLRTPVARDPTRFTPQVPIQLLI